MKIIIALIFSVLYLMPDTVMSSPWQAERMLDEPVFDGQILICEAGRGNAELLLLLHGIGSEAAEIWEPFVAELSARYHVVAPDLPGFGRSSRANKLYSPDNYSRFVDWLIGQFPDRPMTLVGHSLGGAIALYYASHHDGELERLILIDSVGLLHRLAVSQNFVRDLIALELPFFSTQVESRLGRLAGLLLEKTSRVPLDPDLILATAATRERVLGADPTKIAALALVQSDFSLLLPRVRTPTWLIWGAQDQIAPVRIATILEWNLAQTQVNLLHDLGHSPMLESPQRFSAALLEALQPEPVKPKVSHAATGKVNGICENEKGLVFRGDYNQLQIRNCTDVSIVDATVTMLDIADSQVKIERSTIRAQKHSAAVRVLRSQMMVTGVDFYGQIGIVTDQSRLDLAGVRFFDTDSAVVSEGNPSSLLFSSSLINNAGVLTPLHLSRSIDNGETL